ncbi:hypothetical protein, partial [Burkholderia pseudomallei]
MRSSRARSTASTHGSARCASRWRRAASRRRRARWCCRTNSRACGPR